MPHEIFPGRSAASKARQKKIRPGPFEQLKSLLSRSKLHPSGEMTEDRISSILVLRRARDEVFGADLFSDPAWDTLLELYAAELGRRDMSISNLALAMHQPESTTARWIVALQERDLVVTEENAVGFDLSVNLTVKARSGLKHLADHWACAFLST